MNSSNFVTDFRRQIILALDAIDAAESKLALYGDLGGTVTLDPYFNNTTPQPTDPITKADVVDAGAALTALLGFIGSGPGSVRARLNKLR